MHQYGVFRRLLGCGAGEDRTMTDTTHEAPDRIWAGNWLADLGQGSWDIGEWRNEDWPSEGYKTVEYVRADLVQAAVERGFWLGRSCGGSKAEIDAALAAIRRGGE